MLPYVLISKYLKIPLSRTSLTELENFTVFHASRKTFFLVNRVENQNEPKRPQGGGRLGSFWFSTRPSADTGTDYYQDFDYGTN